MKFWCRPAKGFSPSSARPRIGRSRKQAFLGDNVTLALHDARDGTSYAALNHGHFGVKLQRRRKGAAWEEIAAPAYPPKPEGLNDLDGWGKPVKWTTQMIWALEAGGADEPGLLWAGTMPGGLFRSRDGGTSWEMIRPLWDMPARNKWLGGGADIPGIHSICVDPRSSKTVRVAVSCGGVWVTHDGGATWACKASGMKFDQGPPETAEDPGTQDAHMMVQCQASPDRLWVQHHCGIYISRDCCESWQEVKAKPSSFGFGVVVHPKDPDTAWFVPGIKDEKRYPVDGKLVVTRTRDGGKSFDVLSNGLPERAFLRHRVPSRAGRRCNGRETGLRLDHRQSVGERGPGRPLAGGKPHIAAGACGEVGLEVAGGHCAICQGRAADAGLERIEVWQDGLWRLTTSLSSETPGFSYLEPKRHIPYITDLDGEEAASFGPTMQRVTRVLREVTGAEVVYIYIFGDGVPHLHVHLAPHTAGDPLNDKFVRGAVIEEKLPNGFTRIVSKDYPLLPVPELQDIAEKVSRLLAG